MRHLLAAVLLIASVAASSTVFAAMTSQERTVFVQQCQKQMYESQAVCTCMAGIADKTLDDLDIQYLNLNALDPNHASAISKQMTQKELNAVDHFMSSAPDACRKPH
ncbi:MAG TPA: hypothetical protein VHZ56_10860 [Devosia sp.]|jgi:hypothetical protein|nr:hypothetical protein [Devosia sp.]